ncbi:NTP transferase domain-containing protein [Patescibacteria group bacterium]|nr:NTP transferase domain-containing protein [Patescibacteria group bacterium]MBU1885805.1 NTP transferase domain-containing protein [Patescibacteria group bacterium]
MNKPNLSSEVNKRVRKAIITDAGFASRYLPISKTMPKAMLPLGNRPIMQLLVEECAEAGIEEIIIVATPEGKPIYEDYFNNNVNRIRKQLATQGKEDRYESVQYVLDFPKILVIVQDPSFPYGNGSPVVSAQKFVEEEEAFLVLYSDDVIFGEQGDAKTLVDKYEIVPHAEAIIMAQEIDPSVVSRYGIISFKEGSEDELDNIIEKPSKKDAPSCLASYGRYLLKPSIFQHLIPINAGKDNELWTVDAITRLTKTKKVVVEKTKGQWMTTGDPENYFKTHLKFVMKYESYGKKVADWVDKFKN